MPGKMSVSVALVALESTAAAVVALPRVHAHGRAPRSTPAAAPLVLLATAASAIVSLLGTISRTRGMLRKHMLIAVSNGLLGCFI